MDWTAAIEKHREALKGIVAALVAMAAARASFSLGCGDAPGRHPEVRAEGEPRGRCHAISTAPCSGCCGRLNPRRGAWSSRWRAGSRASDPAPAQVQPAEGAQGLFAPGARRCRHRHRAQARRAGSGHCPSRSRQSRCPPAFLPVARSAAAMGGRRRWQLAAGLPRICVPGVTERLAVPAWQPPLPDDPLDAGRLGRRLAALARALDDLPGQARRFARWKARRDRALARRPHSPRYAAARRPATGRAPGALRSGRPASEQHPRRRRDPGARPRAGPSRAGHAPPPRHVMTGLPSPGNTKGRTARPVKLRSVATIPHVCERRGP